MATDQSIPPFPADIDRDAFGHWLAGFVDGEGCFILTAGERSPTCFVPGNRFAITLRADDVNILEMAQSFLGAGRIVYSFLRKERPGYNDQKPTCVFTVSRLIELHNILIPTFEKYPLRAKKRRDFAIWKVGIELCYRVKQRTWCRRMGTKTVWPKWSQLEIATFKEIVDELKSVRKFESPDEDLEKYRKLDKAKGVFRYNNLFD